MDPLPVGKYDAVRVLLRAHTEGGEVDSFAQHVQRSGIVTAGLAYAALFGPPLVEGRGMVFQAFTYLEHLRHDLAHNVDKWLDHYGGNRRNTQAMINHIDPRYFFSY